MLRYTNTFKSLARQLIGGEGGPLRIGQPCVQADMFGRLKIPAASVESPQSIVQCNVQLWHSVTMSKVMFSSDFTGHTDFKMSRAQTTALVEGKS